MKKFLIIGGFAVLMATATANGERLTQNVDLSANVTACVLISNDPGP